MRPDIVRRRKRWKAFQKKFTASRLVFIDETWVKTNMAPLRGWAKKGKRLLGRAPHGHWKTMTFLAALRYDCLTAPCVFEARSMVNVFWPMWSRYFINAGYVSI
jgi:DDE superfamily endonuclease